MSISRMSVDELNSTAEYLSDLSEKVVFLSEAARVLASSIDYRETFESLSRLTVPRIADWVSINIILPDGRIERVVQHHAEGIFNERLRRLPNLPPPKNAHVGISQVMRTHDPILLRDHADKYLDVLEEAGWGPELIGLLREMKMVSAMAVPMIKGKGQVIGGLTLFTSERSNRHYNEKDLRMAQELSVLAAMAIHNAALHREAVNEVQRMRVMSSMREAYIRKQIHDIRTPLTAIAMLVELMARVPAAPERIHTLVDRARQNIDRASRLLDNLIGSHTAEAA